jgi:exoribonuclease II
MNPIQGIVDFNLQRQLTKYSPSAEYEMLQEELQEFMWAGATNDENEMVDALCDIIVVATGALHKLGYYPQVALQETVKEITSREGSFNEETGKWQKDPNQDPSTLYKACYSNAKR